jgi:hypothetical protein
MKHAFTVLFIVCALVAVVWGYGHRKTACYRFSSFAGEKVTQFQKSRYAKEYPEAKEAPEADRFQYRLRIRWDLWCAAMSADIQPPKEKDGRIFFRVDATDRSDTECIYVFDHDGALLEIAWVPLA